MNYYCYQLSLRHNNCTTCHLSNISIMFSVISRALPLCYQLSLRNYHYVIGYLSSITILLSAISQTLPFCYQLSLRLGDYPGYNFLKTSVDNHCLLIHLSIIWIHVMSCVHPAGCLAGQLSWPGKNFYAGRWTSYANFSIFFFFKLYLPYLQVPLTSIILYPFPWPWPCLGVTKSVQNKTFWLHFFTHFQTDQSECHVVLKQFKLKIPTLFLSEIQ